MVLAAGMHLLLVEHGQYVGRLADAPAANSPKLHSAAPVAGSHFHNTVHRHATTPSIGTVPDVDLAPIAPASAVCTGYTTLRQVD